MVGGTRMSVSPTQRSLRYLREQGWPLVEVTERWNPHARIRQDLFGFIDLLAVGPAGVLAVQTTTSENVAARVKKIGDHPNIAAVREAGIGVHVHGWSKRQGRWTLRCIDVS